MISKEMTERLNKQMNMEFHASYAYIGMSAYCSSLSLNGFAQWFDIQSQEETVHARKIYTYLLDQDSSVKLLPIDGVETEFDSALAVFEAALAQERNVSKSINEIALFATDQRDKATQIFLQWFITEQIEEESAVRDIVDRLKLVKDSGEGLLMLDRELGARQPE